MKTPLGTEVDLDPGHIVLDGVPAPAKGHSSPPLFSGRVYSGLATVAHLSYSLALVTKFWQGWTTRKGIFSAIWFWIHKLYCMDPC